MIKSRPIKRNPALVQFSKDHHFALLFIWKIRQGLRMSINPTRIIKYIHAFFEVHLKEHFKEEEELLLIHLDKKDELRSRAEKDHKVLIDLNERLKTDASSIKEFTDVLDQHIRFEERSLFAHLQDKLGQPDLNSIMDKMNTSNTQYLEEWPDEFWKK